MCCNKFEDWLCNYVLRSSCCGLQCYNWNAVTIKWTTKYIHTVTTILKYIHTVTTILKYIHTVTTILKYIHTVTTILKYIHTVTTILKYIHTVTTILKSIHTVTTILKSNWKTIETEVKLILYSKHAYAWALTLIAWFKHFNKWRD